MLQKKHVLTNFSGSFDVFSHFNGGFWPLSTPKTGSTFGLLRWRMGDPAVVLTPECLNRDMTIMSVLVHLGLNLRTGGPKKV